MKSQDHPRPALAAAFQTDVVLVDPASLLLQRVPEQPHGPFHFVTGPPPVLAGEREQRKDFDSALAADSDNIAHGIGAGAMSGDPGQPPPPCPTPAPIHDDCHMSRKASPVRTSASLLIEIRDFRTGFDVRERS